VAKLSWHTKLPVLLGATLATSAGLIVALAGPSAAQLPHYATAAHGTVNGAAHKSGSSTAAKGDNGTVKIHRSTTPVTDRRNQPHVCVFYLDAFGFDPAQSVSWQIKSWPPTGNRTVVLSGTLTMDSSGNGHTGDLTLPNGHYKLFWTFTGENGRAKQKVFWVKCPSTSPSPSPSPSSTSPTPLPSPTPSG
jgi:hypothetical protein